MTSLAQQLIDQEFARHTAALTVIEANTGLIAEAETIAATLRSFGVSDAEATGFTTCIGTMPGTLTTYVSAGWETNAETLLQALKDADLPIAFLDNNDNYGGQVHLHGLDVTISISPETSRDLATRLKTCARLLMLEADR